jgi:hypothetical protein
MADRIAVITLFVGTGVVLMTTGIIQAGWKHKALIWTLVAGGGAFVITGAFYWLVEKWFPTIAEGMADIATHPASWFSTFILLLSGHLWLRWRGTRALQIPAVSGVNEDQISTLQESIMEPGITTQRLNKSRLSLKLLPVRLTILKSRLKASMN